MYIYVGNNPLTWVDPTGRFNQPVQSFYRQNTFGSAWFGTVITGTGNPETNDPGTTIAAGGCAITACANVSTTAGPVQDPNDINDQHVIDDGQYAGNINWWSVGESLGMDTNRIPEQLTHETWEEQEADESTGYLTLVRVEYNDVDPDSPHWVGVDSVYTDDDGNEYFKIAPSSNGDQPENGGPLSQSRQNLGWIQIEGETYVPAERTTAYVTFSWDV